VTRVKVTIARALSVVSECVPSPNRRASQAGRVSECCDLALTGEWQRGAVRLSALMS